MRNTKPLGSLREPIPRDASDDKPAMICRAVFEEMCILANGDIVCSCADPTGQRIYGNVQEDRIADVFDGPMYREIREWQLRSRPDSWCPVIESDCAGRVTRARTADRIDGRWVKLLQLEPSSHCNLRCPACPVTTHFADPLLRSRAGQMLPLDVMIDVIAQLPSLETLLFYNFGEPFLHKDAIPFLRETRRIRPDVFIAVSTNALPLNGRKIRELAQEALVDKLVFAIDGFDPESYRKYRVGGDLSRALQNMVSFVEEAERANTRHRVDIVWQYILFEWNDSDAEIEDAKAFARAHKIEIDWKLTHTLGASTRFRAGSVEFNRLTEKNWNHHSATCEVQLKDFIADGGIADGRYLARVTPATAAVTVEEGSTFVLDVHVENLTATRWDVDELIAPKPGERGLVRIGVLLRTPTGRRIRELAGCLLPVEACKPGGRCTAQLVIEAPTDFGNYELLVDVVEEGVCWFFERGSPPGLCQLAVLPTRKSDPYGLVALRPTSLDHAAVTTM